MARYGEDDAMERHIRFREDAAGRGGGWAQSRYADDVDEMYEEDLPVADVDRFHLPPSTLPHARNAFTGSPARTSPARASRARPASAGRRPPLGGERREEYRGSSGGGGDRATRRPASAKVKAGGGSAYGSGGGARRPASAHHGRRTGGGGGGGVNDEYAYMSPAMVSLRQAESVYLGELGVMTAEAKERSAAKKKAAEAKARTFAEPEELYKENMDLKKVLRQLQADLKAARAKSTRQETEIARKGKMIDELLSGKEFGSSRFDPLRSENTLSKSLKKRVKSLEASLAAKEAEVGKLKSDSRMTRVAELELEVKTYYNESRRLQKLLAAQRNAGAGAGGDASAGELDAARIREKMLHYKTESKNLKVENAALEKKIIKYTQENEELCQRLLILNQHVKNLPKGDRATVAELQRNVQALRQEVQSKNAMIEIMEADHRTRQAELAMAERAGKDAEQEKALAREQKRVASLKSDVERHLGTIDAQKEQLQKADERIASLQEANRKSRQDGSVALNEAREELEAEVARLKRVAAESRKDLKKATDALKDTQAERDELQETLKRRERELQAEQREREEHGTVVRTPGKKKLERGGPASASSPALASSPSRRAGASKASASSAQLGSGSPSRRKAKTGGASVYEREAQAATKIQASFRGHRARASMAGGERERLVEERERRRAEKVRAKARAEAEQAGKEEEQAALTIQSRVRGNQARRKIADPGAARTGGSSGDEEAVRAAVTRTPSSAAAVSGKPSAASVASNGYAYGRGTPSAEYLFTEEEDAEREQAAVKIQARVRGRQARAHAPPRTRAAAAASGRAPPRTPPAAARTAASPLSPEDEAARQIQKAFRGQQARKQLDRARSAEDLRRERIRSSPVASSPSNSRASSRAPSAARSAEDAAAEDARAAARNGAAVKIQAQARGRQTRKAAAARRDADAAAAEAQAEAHAAQLARLDAATHGQRGDVRRRYMQREDRRMLTTRKNAAATKIQASYRGHAGRKRAAALRTVANSGAAAQPAADSDSDDGFRPAVATSSFNGGGSSLDERRMDADDDERL